MAIMIITIIIISNKNDLREHIYRGSKKIVIIIINVKTSQFITQCKGDKTTYCVD